MYYVFNIVSETTYNKGKQPENAESFHFKHKSVLHQRGMTIETVRPLTEQLFSAPDSERFVNLPVEKAGRLGWQRLADSPFNITTTEDIVGRSNASS